MAEDLIRAWIIDAVRRQVHNIEDTELVWPDYRATPIGLVKAGSAKIEVFEIGDSETAIRIQTPGKPLYFSVKVARQLHVPVSWVLAVGKI